MDESIFFATLTELNERLRKREFSSEELTRAFCDRLESLGPKYNALALSLRKPALKQAKEVDGDIKRERLRGTLQGIPFGAKDLLSVAGQPTTWGAKPYAKQVFNYDATVLRKLASAGAVLAGKLAMVELAGGGGYRFADASLFGPGLNPWDTTRWSGGSSSGSGSAVAAGLVPYALGSETSGSIVTPCAYCGITGLRPTYGLVSRHGAMPLSWTMDKIGPMARSADDCGHILRVIAGGDANDPGSAGKGFYYRPQPAEELKLRRVGFATADFEGWAAPAMRPALKGALDVLRGFMPNFADVAMREDLPYGDVTGMVIDAEGASVFEPLIRSGAVDQLADKAQIAGLKAALDIPARDYLKAMRIRRLIQAEFRRLLNEVDVLVAPARLSVANKLEQPLDAWEPPKPEPKSKGLTSIIGAGNLAGLPALVLPCGLAEGMPVGIQIVGKPWSENLLLSIGRAFQGSTEWHKKKPQAAS